MAGNLTHSVADIVRNLIIDLSLGTLPSSSAAWPVFAEREPDKPDNCITVYGSQGRDQGRMMIDGEREIQHGVQISVRSQNTTTGHQKALTIATTLDDSVKQTSVTFSAKTYLVHSVNRTSDVLYAGKDPDTKRNLFTINAVVPLEQTV